MVPNQLLKQRYRILKKAGGGGFGIVYQAEDTLFRNRPVAVKEMKQIGQSQQQVKEAVEAFQREARMLANFEHQNLPKIYDYFEDAGQWYLVMDFVEGETLTDFLNLEDLDKTKIKKLPLVEVLDIGIQLCTVLDYLHTYQPPIIFRDLKPSNIMRTSDGHIFLIDFGIARHFKPGQSKDTIPFGSPGYASREHYGKAQTTPRSDIYSLGATLHQLLSREDPSNLPFTFSPLSSLNIPADLEKLIMQMVDMDANKRPPSASFIKRELQQIEALQKPSPVSQPPSAASNPPIGIRPMPSPVVPPSPKRQPVIPVPVVKNNPPGGIQIPPKPGKQAAVFVSPQQINPPNLNKQPPAAPAPINPPVQPLAPQKKPPAVIPLKPQPPVLPKQTRRKTKSFGIVGAGLLIIALLFAALSLKLNSGSVNLSQISSTAPFTFTKSSATFNPKIIYVTSYIKNNGTTTGSILSAVRTSDGTSIWSDQINDDEYCITKLIAPIIYLGCIHYSNISNVNSSSSDIIYAIRASDGARLWNYQVPGQNVRGSPDFNVIGNVLYTTLSINGYFSLYALQAENGNLQWKYQPDEEDIALPQGVANGIVYAEAYNFQYHRAKVYAFRSADGTILWQYPLDIDVEGFPQDVLVSNGVVYAASPISYNRFQYPYNPSQDYQINKSTIYALRTNDGTLLWKYQIEKESSFTKMELVNGILYTSSASPQNSDGAIHALRANNGSLLWKYQVHIGDSNEFTDTMNADGAIFIASQGNTALYALRDDNGLPVWHTGLAISDGNVSQILVAGQVVYVAVADQTQSYVEAIRETNGSVLWSKPVNGDVSVYASTLVIGGPTLYIGSYNEAGVSSLYALQAENGSVLWSVQGGSAVSIVPGGS